MSIDTAAPRNPIVRHFATDHLPPHLAAVAAPFHRLAHQLDAELTPGPETTTALRKLLEGKDCAVRSVLESGTLRQYPPKV